MSGSSVGYQILNSLVYGIAGSAGMLTLMWGTMKLGNHHAQKRIDAENIRNKLDSIDRAVFDLSLKR